MDEPLEIKISKFQQYISDTHSIATYQEGNTVVVQLWNGKILTTREHLSYEEYKKFRADVPEYGLPDYAPPKTTKDEHIGTTPNGNTVGRVIGSVDFPNKKNSDYNPTIDEELDPELNSKDNTLYNIQLSLDLLSIIPGIGTIAGGTNAAISIGRGNYTEAMASAAAMIPFAGGLIKGGVLIGKTGGKFSKSTARLRDGGKGKRVIDPRCILRPYKIKGRPTCPPPLTGHHVVPDRVFRLGSRTRIPGGLSNNDGLVICVQGKDRTGEHGRIHRIYDPEEQAVGLLNSPRGTAPLLTLEEIGARAVSRVTKCNEANLSAQLRGYHQSKGLQLDFIGRADPYGHITKTIPVESVGSKSNSGTGPL
ncbi:hypothetical protein K4A76_15650 [Pseudomonas sp. NEEL19]|uniref:hypothetical protein n=1 Tax=Pseudomonas sp. NEEL19 TaxID=2867409 RepID=UPI0023679194|nr:hypothetical protein [Pseudomonas sp. NEEL19]WDM57901.1 hypothetical protein K4A76_15650 [Pseudomonas sp. NEEL19]